MHVLDTEMISYDEWDEIKENCLDPIEVKALISILDLDNCDLDFLCNTCVNQKHVTSGSGCSVPWIDIPYTFHFPIEKEYQIPCMCWVPK